ncbi:MAG: septal ring lytic transglycosylase RlpA family protein [Paludibacter sp.]|nr:septal ring lytic transglycosylase RlpA family protein [Paludibacter sp.]
MIRFLQLTVFFILFSVITVSGQKLGNASYYSHKLQGRHTADGGRYNPDSLTCAHRSYPLGTYLLVRNPKNDHEVIVKVTDRGPHQRRLAIDLSYCAASVLDIVRAGIARVEITRLDSLPLKFPIYSPIPIPVKGLTSENSNVILKLSLDNIKGKLRS